MNVLMHIRRPGTRPVLFGLRIHDIAQSVNRDPRFRHFRDRSAKAADRPGQQTVVGNQGNIAAGSQISAHAQDRAEHRNQHCARRRYNIAFDPECRKRLLECNPKACIIFVLLLEALLLIAFPAERADNAHTGQVFLRDARKPAFLHVRLLELVRNLLMKENRPQHHDRNENRRDDR